MTVAAPRSFFSSRFFVSLISLALVLLALGGSVFRYLTASPKRIAAQDQPIAIATTFVPVSSPFSASLLTSPEALRSPSQAQTSQPSKTISPAAGPQTATASQQLQQSLLAKTGLDYERDLLPWIGSEVTFALVDADIDLEATNGQQPGYLLAAAIAPQRQQAAREFLQTLWQRRNLVGKAPKARQISGVQALYRDDLSGRGTSSVTAASALVGDRFVLLANDIRVLQRSIRAAQSVTNLAQNKAYRDAVAQLPAKRVGLAYWDSSALRDSGELPIVRSHTAMSLERRSDGVLVTLRQAHKDSLSEPPTRLATLAAPTAAMAFVPIASTQALNAVNLAQQLSEPEAALASLNITLEDLPDFLAVGNAQNDFSAWDWATGDYALARVGKDWILAVRGRDADSAELDSIAKANGFSAVPVALPAVSDEKSIAQTREAIAWTRFKAKPSRRASDSQLETEVMGLRIRQGEYDVFASSLAAMEQALAAGSSSLRDAAPFNQAVAALPQPNSGYFYWDKSQIAAFVKRQPLVIQQIVKDLNPLLSSAQRLSATRVSATGADTISVYIQTVNGTNGTNEPIRFDQPSL